MWVVTMRLYSHFRSDTADQLNIRNLDCGQRVQMRTQKPIYSDLSNRPLTASSFPSGGDGVGIQTKPVLVF